MGDLLRLAGAARSVLRLVAGHHRIVRILGVVLAVAFAVRVASSGTTGGLVVLVALAVAFWLRKRTRYTGARRA